MAEDPSTPTEYHSPPAKPDLLAYETKKSIGGYAYGLMATFVACTLLILVYNPSTKSSSSSSPWYLKDAFHIKHLYSNSPHPHQHPLNSPFSALPLTNPPAPAPQPTPFDGYDTSSKTNSYNTSSKTNTSESVYGYDESMLKCDLFDGKWVRDDSYPLYAAGSCPHIDEPFNCFLNNRPDNGYERYRWQPNHCHIPRLKGKDMLELIRGKRLVFVGDSLNRNMWESLVCILKSSVDDKSRVFEASGRHEFRTEGSYSFIFKDYNCSVEFFRSPFLVQEWETPNQDGSKNETLRLDLVETSSNRYKDADILVFNSGHWWTHDKTGKNFYQEGSHVYGKLNVVEAYRRAMTTWGRWVDSNVNPLKTQVFFRGYSATHFRGGKWNSGGRCEKETEPFKNETYLLKYPTKMKMVESVIKGMKTHVTYLNITRLTDYRKDAHPAVYRAQHLSEEERRDPVRFQDCSHWCLPGVPDTWNEILYARILINHYKKHKHKTAT